MNNRRTAFIVSDQTGITADTLAHTLMTQFENVQFDLVTLPFVNTVDKAQRARQQIDEVWQSTGQKGIVFSTLVDNVLRSIVAQANALHIDLIGQFIGPLEQELKQSASHTIGKAHSVTSTAAYKARIDAMHFALENDDGATLKHYDRADVILIGVSRSGKTPTCLYLAQQYGIYAANYPITDHDLEGMGLPKALAPWRQKVHGLTIDAQQLHNIRQERRPNSEYSSMRQCQTEVRQVEHIFRSDRLPYINTTAMSIEEISTRIIQGLNLPRRFF